MNSGIIFLFFMSQWEIYKQASEFQINVHVSTILLRGGSRISFRRGCTRLLHHFNTNKQQSFFFLHNTSCIRKPLVISGGGGVCTPCTLPLDLPLLLSFWVGVTCQPTFTLVKHFNYLPLVSFQTNQESIVPNASTPTSAFLASWKEEGVD